MSTQVIVQNNGTSIVVSHVGAQGPAGPAGSSAVQTLGTFTAAEAIPSSSLVHISQSNGQAYKADRSLGREAHGFTIAGISLGASATITRTGSLTGLTGKTSGKKQWLSTGGLSIETAPTSGIVQEVGYASSATAVFVDAQLAVVLS